jgi:FAD/FMN-containing dehydrogenase
MNVVLDAVRAAISSPVGYIDQPNDMSPYLNDWRGMFSGDALCVARPGSTEEVARLVRIASEYNVALVPQGGNTGLAGGATPTGTRPQILLSLNRMSQIRKIDRAGLTITAEAGCILHAVKQAAKEVGRQVPISFASEGSASIGGMISTNAGGVNALRYGTARHLVLGLEVVLSDGTVLNGLRNLRKDVAGYDLKQLFIGSEGTLGIVTAAVLRMAPLSHQRCAGFVSINSAGDALRLLEHLHGTLGDCIGAFELMSDASIQRVIRLIGGRLPTSSAPWYVLVEAADCAPELETRLQEALIAPLEAGYIEDAAVSMSLNELQEFWTLRENMGEAEKHAGRSVKHDVAVGVCDVPRFLEEAATAIGNLRMDLDVNAFGHVGDGNIHFNVLGSRSKADDVVVNRAVHDVVARFDGSIAAEHGIGQYRVEELLLSKSRVENELMATLKRALDPALTLNPGKVVGIV